MTGRLASRATEVAALLARFNDVSEDALAALGRGDGDALDRALDVRAALQTEIERAMREVQVTRSRFAPNDERPVPGLASRAVDRYCAPLEELARVAEELQHRLEASASRTRDGLLAEIAEFENRSAVATRYASNGLAGSRRFDVRL